MGSISQPGLSSKTPLARICCLHFHFTSQLSPDRSAANKQVSPSVYQVLLLCRTCSANKTGTKLNKRLRGVTLSAFFFFCACFLFWHKGHYIFQHVVFEIWDKQYLYLTQLSGHQFIAGPHKVNHSHSHTHL